MSRIPIALAVMLGLASMARGQDMPLSQILIEGEGWKKAEGKLEKPKAIDLREWLGDTYINAETDSSDGATLFAAVPGQRFLFAAPLLKNRSLASPLMSYAPLRTRRSQSSIEVTGLVADRDGRIYAATDIGVQVFDPTGRLCGVLTPAAPGSPEFMEFDGDQLTMWIGDSKYTRKINASGVK